MGSASGNDISRGSVCKGKMRLDYFFCWSLISNGKGLFSVKKFHSSVSALLRQISGVLYLCFGRSTGHICGRQNLGFLRENLCPGFMNIFFILYIWVGHP